MDSVDLRFLDMIQMLKCMIFLDNLNKCILKLDGSYLIIFNRIIHLFAHYLFCYSPFVLVHF